MGEITKSDKEGNIQNTRLKTVSCFLRVCFWEKAWSLHSILIGRRVWVPGYGQEGFLNQEDIRSTVGEGRQRPSEWCCAGSSTLSWILRGDEKLPPQLMAMPPLKTLYVRCWLIVHYNIFKWRKHSLLSSSNPGKQLWVSMHLPLCLSETSVLDPPPATPSFFRDHAPNPSH